MEQWGCPPREDGSVPVQQFKKTIGKEGWKRDGIGPQREDGGWDKH